MPNLERIADESFGVERSPWRSPRNEDLQVGPAALVVEVCVQDCTADLVSTPPELAQLDPAIWEAWFQAWVAELDPDLAPSASYELSLRLTGDRDIQDLNRDYRYQDKPTDVLAFAALETEMPTAEDFQDEPLYLGDIIISVETAQQQAQTAGHSLAVELAWLAAHGLLHLLGWDHPDEFRLEEMLNQQQVLLRTVGIQLATS